MNANCDGDWFLADNRIYYRCFWDSIIIPMRDSNKPETCSHCQRPVEPLVKLIKPQIRTARQVRLGDNWVNVN